MEKKDLIKRVDFNRTPMYDLSNIYIRPPPPTHIQEQ